MKEEIFLRKLKYSKLLKLDIVEKANTLQSYLEVMYQFDNYANKDIINSIKKELRFLKIEYLSDDKE